MVPIFLVNPLMSKLNLKMAIWVVVGVATIALYPITSQAQWTNGSNINNTNTGNVGIGTTSPGRKLHVAGDAVKFERSGQSVEINPNYALSNTHAAIAVQQNKDFRFILNDDTSALTVLSLQNTSGNVGIGTTAPAAPLHIKGTTSGYTPALWVSDQNMTLGGMMYFEWRGGAVNNKIHAIAADSNGLGIYRMNDAGTGFVNSTPDFSISPSGNVGIGTTSPAEKLHVAGSIKVDGNINAKYQDLAEWVPSAEQLAAGTVVVLDTTKSNQVVSSTASYDTRVAGVISAQPGITLGEGGEGKVLVATTGRVRVKVDASRGAIQIGDLLVTSDVPGVAMKSEAVNLGGVAIHRPGTIIGKALEPLAKGKGEILVLLSLQ